MGTDQTFDTSAADPTTPPSVSPLLPPAPTQLVLQLAEGPAAAPEINQPAIRLEQLLLYNFSSL